MPEATEPALRQASDATRRGNLIARLAYGNPAVLGTFPSVLDDKLEEAHFELDGTLLSVEDGTWNVGGLVLRDVNSSHEVPPAGRAVDMEGLVRDGRVFISEIEHDEEIAEGIKIKGVFGGTNSDGTIWYVGGIPIGRLEGLVPPALGTRVELKGVIQNGVFSTTKIESEEHEEGKIEIEGVLAQIDSSKQAIVVSIAGNQVTVSIGEAIISDEDGRRLTFSDLESLVGEEIEVRGVYLKDGGLYATEVRVDIELEDEPEKGQQEADREADNDKDEVGWVNEYGEGHEEEEPDGGED